MSLIARYTAFAVIATLANLGVQRLVLGGADTPLRLALAMAAGTLVGLVVKYVLDKRWIFDDRSTGTRAHARRFTAYTVMGGVTTLIFWGSETAFWLAIGTDLAREGGALLGLTIGYVVKYQLDKRYVFTPA
ncbi:MAG: GtrA family protein [Pseudomonadota bacterium]|nr:GtrA family protein [Pseudomonadota bacterium]